MEMGNKTVCVVLLAVVMSVTSAGGKAEGLGINKNLESTESRYAIESSAAGIGSDQQDAVSKAANQVGQGELNTADRLLDDVLRHFANLMTDKQQTYVSFRNDKDYRQFVQESKSKQIYKITRVHDSFVQALQLKAFIASSRQEWDTAIRYLDKKILYAPFEAQPFLEKGYCLTNQGNPQQGFEAYKKAYALATAHNSALQEKSAALRGMGSAQIELGNLDEAATLFNRSLELEAGNKVALSELEYIRQMKAKGR